MAEIRCRVTHATGGVDSCGADRRKSQPESVEGTQDDASARTPAASKRIVTASPRKDIMKASITLALVAGLAAGCLAAPDAEARQRSGSGSFATGGGKAGTYQRSIDRSPGAVSRQGSITTQDGHVYSRSSTGTYDRSTGAVNRSMTGAGGRTRTSSGTYDRDTNTYERTITGANGGQAHATTTYDRDARSASSTYVGPGGKTATSTSTYSGGNKGFDTTLTGADGRTYTRSSSNTWNGETGTRTKSVTGYDGNTRTVDVTPDRPN
jgi:hypothetical protein